LKYEIILNRPIFPVEERERLLKKITTNVGNVEIVRLDGLVADFVKQKDVDFIVN
jgi:phosphopantetheine adenylyltransferase